MGEALEKSIKHWQEIVKEIEETGYVRYDEYHGKNCPLCQEYYDKFEEDYECWACPLAYREWCKYDDDDEGGAFGGGCASEWNQFTYLVSLNKELKLAIDYRKVKEGGLERAKEMLKVLEELDEEKRFKNWRDFENEVEVLG